jgi:hypothetical protein
MKRLLIKFAMWVLKRYAPAQPETKPVGQLTLSAEVMELARAAQPLCAAVDKFDASGEYKRHSVYARLLKSFPNAIKRDVALAIEIGLMGVE